MNRFLKNRTVIGLICIFLSLLICFGLTPLFNKSLQAQTEIVRVSKIIKSGDMIKEDQVQIVKIGGYNLPDSVIKKKDEVIGKYSITDLYKDDYIVRSKLSTTPLTENEYLYKLDGKKRAISITVQSFAAGLSGKLEAEDIVSVITTEYGDNRQTVILPELQFVEVLAVTSKSGADRSYEKSSSSTDEELDLPSTITLLVDTTQAKRLAELEATGRIHLALVYRGDDINKQKFLDQQEVIILDTKAKQNDNVTGGDSLEK